MNNSDPVVSGQGSFEQDEQESVWSVLLLLDQQRWYCGRTGSQLTGASSSRCRASLNFVHTSTLIPTDVFLQQDCKVSDFRPKRNGEASCNVWAVLSLSLARSQKPLSVSQMQKRMKWEEKSELSPCPRVGSFSTVWGCGLLSDAMKDDDVCLLYTGPAVLHTGEFLALSLPGWPSDAFITWAVWALTHRRLIRTRAMFRLVTSTLKPVPRVWPLIPGRHPARRPGFVEMENKIDVITPLFADCSVSFVFTLVRTVLS